MSLYATEEALWHAWAGAAGRAVYTQEGELVRVLFPGRRTGGPGPDYRGAYLETERGGRVRGDVEIHLAASGWRAHGHQGDRRYNGVVLHVVGYDDEGLPTRLASGRRVPVAVLPRGPGDGPMAPGRQPCCGGERCEELRAALTEQGMLRFRSRVTRWRRLPPSLWDEALYRALLEGLGYGGNRRAFRRLARLVPWSMLRTIPGTAGRQALLTQTAGLRRGETRGPGFGPAATGGPGPAGTAVNRPLRPGLLTASWRGWSCRPAAAPVRRLLGFAALTTRWDRGPAASLIEWRESLPPPARASGLIRRWFAVAAGEAGLAGSAPLGRGRADVLAANVVLPFIAAAMEEAWALAAFATYPALEEDAIVRGMRSRLSLQEKLRAVHQQGLHRVFRRYCARGLGDWCPLKGRGDGAGRETFSGWA